MDVTDCTRHSRVAIFGCRHSGTTLPKAILHAGGCCMFEENCCLARFAGEYGARCRILPYEDLLAAPEDTVRGLCEFLEIPYAAAMLRPFCLPLSNASVVSMTERVFADARPAD